MLGECNGFECWPICVSIEPVGPCGTLDSFHDGSKDFLKLSRLLHKSLNWSLKDCTRHSSDLCHLSDTYGKEISGPHINVLLDPKYLLLIWDRALLLTRLHYEVFLLTDGSTISSILGRHYISLQIPKDFQSIFLRFLSLTTDGCLFILSPTLPPNAWWLFWGQYWLH